MCTAISIKHQTDHAFLARNFDYDSTSLLKLAKIPRNYSYPLEPTLNTFKTRYSIIGMMLWHEGTHVLVDGMNEKGLSGAILNLPDACVWNKAPISDGINLLPTDVSFYCLSQFSSVTELKAAIHRLNIVAPEDHPFAKTTQIHWMFCDKTGESIVVEQTESGLCIYDNPIGVLTNGPTFDQQLINISPYLKDSQTAPPLPGDDSSPSRFIRAGYLKHHLQWTQQPLSTVTHCFHILENVALLPGILKQTQGEEFETRYTACMDLKHLRYYLKWYHHLKTQIIDLKQEQDECKTLTFFE